MFLLNLRLRTLLDLLDASYVILSFGKNQTIHLPLFYLSIRLRTEQMAFSTFSSYVNASTSFYLVKLVNCSVKSCLYTSVSSEEFSAKGSSNCLSPSNASWYASSFASKSYLWSLSHILKSSIFASSIVIRSSLSLIVF